MAVSVLDTNVGEVYSMAPTFIKPTLVIILLFILNLFIVKNLSKVKVSKYNFAIYIIWFIFPIVFLLKHHFVGFKGGGPTLKTVIYHYNDFKGAYMLGQRMKSIHNNKIDYKYEKTKDGVDVIVLLLGESARKQNSSLYEYERDTNPNQFAQKDKMLIFNKANSPAAITNTSLPLTLSLIEPEKFSTDVSDLADNIINLANQYHYNTYWVSSQNNISGLTEIAAYSKEKKWINGFDLELAKELDPILDQSGKKLIIMHINGSHPNPCSKYPNEFSHFDEGKFVDCYDNSIRYTDMLIGEIFKKIESKNSVFIYLSDHGLKLSDNKWLHIDSKESTQVPFYVWYANDTIKENFPINKDLNQTISTSYVYPMIMNFIGLKEIELPKVTENKYLKLDYKTIPYNDLN